MRARRCHAGLAGVLALLGCPVAAGADEASPLYQLTTTVVTEARHEGNLDLDREHGDRDHRTRLEPLLRLGLRLRPGAPWSGLVETETVHRSERDRGEATRHDTRLLLNQAYLQQEGLLPGTRLRLGRWLQRDEREWLFDESLDGVHARHRRGRWELEAMHARVGHWPRELLRNRPRDRTIDIAGLIVRHEDRDDRIAAAWLLHHHERDSGDRRRHLGLRLHTDPDDRLSLRADLSLVHGRVAGQRLRGEAFDVGATWRFERGPWQPRLRLGHARGSGDGDPDDGVLREHRQTGLQSNDAEIEGIGKFAVYGELLDPELRNLQVTSLGLGLSPTPTTTVDVVLHHVRQPAIGPLAEIEIDPRFDRHDSARLGDEIDLLFGWQPRDGLRLEIVLGTFRPAPRLRADDDAGSPRAGRAVFGRVELLWRL